MPEQLKPCPICGSVNCRLIEREMTAYVVCDFKGCWMSGPIKEYADSAIAAWNQLPRALTWTAEPPKVAGWSWCRMSMLNMPRCVEVYGSEDGLRFGSGESWREPSTSVEDPDFQWAGPIPEPKEPTYWLASPTRIRRYNSHEKGVPWNGCYDRKTLRTCLELPLAWPLQFWRSAACTLLISG